MGLRITVVTKDEVYDKTGTDEEINTIYKDLIESGDFLKLTIEEDMDLL